MDSDELQAGSGCTTGIYSPEILYGIFVSYTLIDTASWDPGFLAEKKSRKICPYSPSKYLKAHVYKFQGLPRKKRREGFLVYCTRNLPNYSTILLCRCFPSALELISTTWNQLFELPNETLYKSFLDYLGTSRIRI